MTHKLTFGYMSLNGELPTQLGQLSLMQSIFQFPYNDLSSTLPTELGNMVKMSSEFEIFANDFTGVPPTELGRLSEVGGRVCARARGRPAVVMVRSSSRS